MNMGNDSIDEEERRETQEERKRRKEDKKQKKKKKRRKLLPMNTEALERNIDISGGGIEVESLAAVLVKKEEEEYPNGRTGEDEKDTETGDEEEYYEKEGEYKKRAAATVHADYKEHSGSEDDVEAASRPEKVVVYGKIPEGLSADNLYECMENKGNCVVIGRASFCLEKMAPFKMVFGYMKGSGYSEEASVQLEKYLSDGKFDYVKKEYPDLEIDERALLLKTEPIRFARIKGHDLRALSTKYNINEHFRRALRDCPNVTVDAFPFLHAISQGTKRGQPNITKLMKASQRKIMLFVVRLHYGIHVESIFVEKVTNRFDFMSFPELELVFVELEHDLENMNVGKDRKTDRKMDKSSNGGEKDDGIVGNINRKFASLLKTMQTIEQTTSKAFEKMKDELEKIKTEVNELPSSSDKIFIKWAVEKAVEERLEKYFQPQKK